MKANLTKFEWVRDKSDFVELLSQGISAGWFDVSKYEFRFVNIFSRTSLLGERDGFQIQISDA